MVIHVRIESEIGTALWTQQDRIDNGASSEFVNGLRIRVGRKRHSQGESKTYPNMGICFPGSLTSKLKVFSISWGVFFLSYILK